MLLLAVYWSSTLTQAERNYSATERECLVVLWASLHLRPYLERTRVTVRTDHDTLKWPLPLSNAEERLAKWRLRLAELDFDDVHGPGVKHQVSDAMSRIWNKAGESRPLDDFIPCPKTLPWKDKNYDFAQILLLGEEDWNFYSCPTDECFSLGDRNLGVDPIPAEELLATQSYDSLCQTLRTKAKRNPSSGFLIREDGVLLR